MIRRTITLADVRDGFLDDIVDPIELSQLLLEWKPNRSFSRQTDIGRFCFSERKGTGHYAYVDPRSLIQHDLLPAVVLGTLRALANRSDSSIPTCLGQLTLLLAADSKHELQTAGDLLKALTRLLRTQRETGDKARNTLANTQRFSIEILCLGFDVSYDSVLRGIPLLSSRGYSASHVRELSREAGAAIARAARDHFLGVANALIQQKPLPLEIVVNDRRFLVTARASAYGNAERYEELDKNGDPHPDSVYSSGLQLRQTRVHRQRSTRSPAEVARHRRRYSAIQKETLRVKRANAKNDSTLRRLLASEALLSFCIYTYFDTGANASTLQGRLVGGIQRNALLVSDLTNKNGSLLLDAERGSMSYVLDTEKARAGNKRVPIVFSSIWVKRVFPVYLRFREYLSDVGVNVPDNLIFLMVSGPKSKNRIDINPNVCSRLRNIRGHILNLLLHEIGFQSITIRQIRNYKSVSLSRSHGPLVSARLLGHSLETALAHYNRVEELEAQLQLSGAINHLFSIAIADPTDTSQHRLPGGGACTKSDDEPIVEIVSDDLGLHAPSCRTRTGCWLCPHFAVHADKTDLWKMKSYLFVINELRMNSLDQIGVSKVHKPIVNRLENLCRRIESLSPDLAETSIAIDRQVASGHLHPIYESLMTTYEEVNLL
jgi:hypothetical protein